MKHNNDFRHDLEVGQEGEKVIAEILSEDTIEVKSEQDKNDKNWTNTNNMFIEISSRGEVSGLAKTKAKWWIHNFYQGKRLCFSKIILVEDLKRIAKKVHQEQPKRKVRGGDSDTSWGILVPIKEIDNSKNYV